MVHYIVLTLLGLATGICALPNIRSRDQSETRLQFTSDGTFQLSIFEDLHYGEAEDTTWGPIQDVESTAVINTILDNENPDLVILNGDLITGDNTFLANATDYIDEIVAPLVERQLLWASTYGNHDSDYNLSRSAILEREQSYSNSLTQSMVTGKLAGVSNYYLPVYPSNSSATTPALIIWFFDSRGGNYFQELENGSEVVEWFTQTNADLTEQYGKVIPSIAFYHIPVNAMLAFQNQGVDAHSEPGINADVPLDQQGEASGQGELPGMNLTGNGLNLCFGRHTGYGGYGSWTRGSRQILLDETTLATEIATWIRLEDGSVSGQVSLNSTYGEDRYPAVATTYT
ncbi:Metallo-dependent phosphatase [Aspergillus violaceofuscus CBS 115571]|uniref:Metallo-dependent phosphatase n=1 Tax=Aspergillus violaceofuscus (strain CBS 115571) TaxID=1450538 RepID=A0A2V5HHK9_ASPV1|nr:Metallo-dependent phosphatase [Aspergillus violaceofuscus CBS 115571]